MSTMKPITFEELQAMPSEKLRKMKRDGLEMERKGRDLREAINDILHIRNIDEDAEKKKAEFLATKAKKAE